MRSEYAVRLAAISIGPLKAPWLLIIPFSGDRAAFLGGVRRIGRVLERLFGCRFLTDPVRRYCNTN